MIEISLSITMMANIKGSKRTMEYARDINENDQMKQNDKMKIRDKCVNVNNI